MAGVSAAGLYWSAAGSPAVGLVALRNAVRRGGLFAAAVVVNLALVAGHKWTVPGFLVILGVAGVLELVGWVRADRGVRA